MTVEDRCVQAVKSILDSVPAILPRTGADAVIHACLPEHIIADQSMAGLCKAEGANRVTTSNTKCITVHLLLTGIDGIHYPKKLVLVLVEVVLAIQAHLLQCSH